MTKATFHMLFDVWVIAYEKVGNELFPIHPEYLEDKSPLKFTGNPRDAIRQYLTKKGCEVSRIFYSKNQETEKEYFVTYLKKSVSASLTPKA